MLGSYNKKKLGKFLKQARKDANLSQAYVSTRLGLDAPQFISNIERGKCVVPTYMLKELICMYEIPAREVTGFLASEYKQYLKRMFE